MFDLYDELRSIVATFNARGVEFALCGGLAMAVYAAPRATVDIDFLIRPEDVEAAFAAAESVGYVIKARPMSFSAGAVEIRRVSKIDPASHDVLSLDFLLVTAASRDVWQNRQQVILDGLQLTVVSREGLIKLKSFRSSGRDLDDIAVLRGEQ